MNEPSVDPEPLNEAASDASAPDGDEQRALEPAGPGYATRFHWATRLFIVLFLGDMLLRGFVTLTPYAGRWRSQFGLSRYPVALPTEHELSRIEAGKEKSRSTGERYAESLGSTFEFLNPIPDERARKAIGSVSDFVKYLAAYAGTRLDFFGALVAVDQGWRMYSPSVRKHRSVARVLLKYDDGTSRQHRLRSEPSNPLHFFRWPQKKPLQAELRLSRRGAAHRGVSNYLAHRFRQNENGARLRAIELYQITYRFPRPGMDSAKFIEREVKRANRRLRDPYWRYDVATGRGRMLSSGKPKKASKKKAKRSSSRKAPKRK